jgi:hypothetical protein
MKARRPSFLGVSLVAALTLAACAAIPPAAAPAPAPPSREPTPAPVAAAVPAATAAPPQSAASEWQNYTNGEAGFSIRYPDNWRQAELPPTEMARGVALDGPEGTVQLYWGTGFGGYCAEAIAVKTAQGELPACHSVDASGIQHWDQVNKELPAVSFSGRAFTKDATPASGDAVLAVLATLAFTSPEPTVTTAANGWQTYANPQAGFSISYPPGWGPKVVSASSPQYETDFAGSEGAVAIQWGEGFGGACYAGIALHLAQGQNQACPGVGDDGTRHWALGATRLPKALIGGFAWTNDAKPASEDQVLAVLATLRFAAPQGPAPADASSAAASAMDASVTHEIVVDSAGPNFWPKGNWYFLKTDQQYGPDCYEALPGLEATAEVRPDLAKAGSYEVFAWWCGNPHYTQTAKGVVEVHRSADDAAPQAVGVNYQANAGAWQSLGAYDLEPGAFLNVKSVLNGNAVADAFRFVYLGEKASAEALPTPLPTGLTATNHPPSREQQMTQGDLATRLGVTGSYYQPITMTQTPATFDDCTTFPREGCSGARQGIQAIVAYEGITLTYRLAIDALLVTIEGADNALNPWLMGQDHPQRVFLTIPGGGSVHYYQDGTWRLLRPADGAAPESDVAVSKENAAALKDLSAKYSTLYVPAASGMTLVFYGLGPGAAPSDADREALLRMADELGAMAR